MKAQFRPCIDLHNGRVKQIVGSSLTDSGDRLRTNFVSELPPEYYAKLYAKYQLDGGHVIMLGPGNETAARRALSAWPGHLQVGGGITADNAAEWLDAGAKQVIVTSFVFTDGELKRDRLEALFNAVGRDRSRLVLDLSCRKRGNDYFVVTDRWQKFTTLAVGKKALGELADYAAEFLVHAVDVEGKRAGIDTVLLEKLAAESPVDCVYAGGVSGCGDIAMIERGGHGRIHYTIGSALDIFGGPLPFEAIAKHSCGDHEMPPPGV